MIDRKQKNLPELFGRLMELGCFGEAEVYATSDGFCAAGATIADILAHRDITTVPGSQGGQLDCRLFFDDRYLYAVSNGADCTYSLFKMREQEYDKKMGRNADGDIPGVTISFIELQTDILLDCLRESTLQNRRRLNEEINRVLQRVPEHKTDLLPDMVQWPDNMDPFKWYYLAIQEATNSHDYSRKENGYEYWTVLKEVRDRSELER